MRLRRRDKASIVNSRRPNIINGLLRVPFRAKMAGFEPKNRMIGFLVRFGRKSVTRAPPLTNSR